MSDSVICGIEREALTGVDVGDPSESVGAQIEEPIGKVVIWVDLTIVKVPEIPRDCPVEVKEFVDS